MKIFLDTANVEEVAKHFLTGLINGVTTNPTLIRKSGRNPDEVYQELAILVSKTSVWKSMVQLKKCLKRACAFQTHLEILPRSNCR